MAIAALYNVPTDQDGLNSWAFAHMDHHRNVNRALFALGNTDLVDYILDPVNPTELGVWVYNHQDWHNNINRLLGTAGYDLTGIDFGDIDNLTAWIRLQADEHMRWADALGVA